MKFLSSFSGGEVVSRFIYEVGTPGGEDKIETPFTAEHLAESARSDEAIQAELAKLNERFGSQVKPEDIPKYIKEIDAEDGNEVLEDLADIQNLAQLLASKFGAEGADGEKVDMAELGLEGLTKEEAEKITANQAKLLEALNAEFKGKDVDPELIESTMMAALNGKPKEELMDEGFVMGLQDQIVTKVKEESQTRIAKFAKETFPSATPEQQAEIASAIGKLQNTVLDNLRNHKDDQGRSVPGISSDYVTPDIISDIEEEIKALTEGLKDKEHTEVLKDIEGGADAIFKKILEGPTIKAIREAQEKAYEGKTLSNESLASGIVNENVEDGGEPLNLREGSIYNVEDVKVGPPGQKMTFSNTENLKTIGAGDLYPPEVREITINGKTATREGIGGSFFYEGGEYAKIVEGDQVVVTKMANSETEEGKKLLSELNQMREDRVAATEKFQFEYKGDDREIEVAPGQKFKTSELVAQMAERYGLDPNLLMSRAAEISTNGTEYLKDLNMAARAIQRTIKSSDVPKDEWYIENEGRRYMNPKLLRNFIGGNEEAIKSYVESSGASYTEDELKALKEQYPGLEGLDGGERLTDAQVRQIVSGKFNIKGGAHLEGYRASAAKGLLLFHEWVSSKTGVNTAGTITDLTNTGNLGGGIRHAGGQYSHGNGYKADLRSHDAFGKAIAQATGLHGHGSMTITSIPGYTIKVLRHQGTGDHFDLQFKPA